MSNRQRVYLDHAATTPVHPAVVEAMIPYFSQLYGNPSSFYQRGRESAAVLQDARGRIASLINADPREIFFTACGTEADNWAIKGAASRLAGKGRHIITSAIEHHAVLHACEDLQKQGFELTVLPVDGQGLVDPAAVKAAIRPDTILVTIMWANNEIGTIQPIREIAAICREQKVLFHSDAVQAAGALPIDVRDLGADMLSFSAHKFYGPKGVGFLYIRRGVRIDNLLSGGAQEQNRRGGTENVAGIVGMAKALELATGQLEANRLRLTGLRDYLIRQMLETVPHVRLNGHPEQRLPNNANFSFEFIEGESILLLLDHYGFECSSGSACTSGSLDPSHVLLAIGLPHEIAHGSLRVTLGSENTREQMDELVRHMADIAARLRDMSPLYADWQKQQRRSAPAAN